MTSDLSIEPARELAGHGQRRFPGESEQYRQARTALFAEEIELRRHIERVAVQRRALNRLCARAKQCFGHLALVTLSVLAGCGAALSHARAQERTSPPLAGLGAEFESERATVNGITLHYVRGGKGPPVILIHAFPQDWSEYRAIMPRLARRFTVIAVDLRGVGGSTAKPGGYDDNAAFNVFSRKDGAIRHTWGDEMGMETADPSQDPRGAPDPMPLLSILDMTPEGRGTTGIRSSTIAADRPPAEHGDGFFAVDNAQAEKNGATTW